MPIPKPRAKQTPPLPIGEDASIAVAAVVEQWKKLLRAIPHASEIERAQDFARFFGLKTKLAWQVWRSMHADGPIEMLQHLPGEPGLRLLWAAIDAKAGRESASKSLRASLRRFRALARVHAGGDTDALTGMLASFEPGRREQLDLMHRESGFQSARSLWGVQAHTTLALSIFHPGAAAHLVDVVALRATLGFQRLRHDVPWIIGRVGCRPRSAAGVDPDPSMDSLGPRFEPIFPSQHGVPSLIRELSSKPLPPLQVIPRTATLADVELRPGPVGELAAMDIVVGDVFRNLPRFHEPTHTPEITPIVFTPSERYVHDLIVFEGAAPAGPFIVDAFGDPRGDGLENAASRQRLPVELSARTIGQGATSLALDGVPTYQAMIETLLARLRWKSGAFALHRIEWAFPVTPSVVRVRFQLPLAPSRNPTGVDAASLR